MDDEKPRITDLLNRCGILPEFWRASITDFDPDKTSRAIRALERGQRRQLYLCGKPGRGKTHFASAICRYWIDKDYGTATGYVHFTSFSRILLRIRTGFDRRESEEDILDSYTYYRLLVLDDIGRERSSEFSRWVLFYLSDLRKSWKRATIYITDKPYDVMRNMLFNEEIMSRIYQHVIHFGGADRRQTDVRSMEIA